MYVGLFDLFKIGIGLEPHTMGPMLAAQVLESDRPDVASVTVDPMAR